MLQSLGVHLTHLFMAQARKNIAHFHGSVDFRLNAEDPILRVAMSVEQARQRLGIAEGVIH